MFTGDFLDEPCLGVSSEAANYENDLSRVSRQTTHMTCVTIAVDTSLPRGLLPS